MQAVQDRVVIFDGGMGTSLQEHNLSLDDYWAKEGCSEVLVLSRPDVVREIHASFFEVGCDVVETNTFGGTHIVLGEYDLQNRVAEINKTAAALAREIAKDFSTPDKPRFVAGSLGPTTKLPSLGHIKFDDMVRAYQEQAAALIEGDVDVLLVETCQDLLQAKAALAGVFDAMQSIGKRVPVTLQVTLEATGTMLMGSEIDAALAALEPYDIDILGLNCATGPKEMNDAIRFLCNNSPKHVSVLPNAGLPQNIGGKAVYTLKPKELAEYHKRFVAEFGVRIVGGCCGTTPEHLKAVVETVGRLEPAQREVKSVATASSSYNAVPLDLDPKPLVVAEEMNTTTSKDDFRKLVQGGKYDDILVLAKRLVGQGSHMLDLCCAIVGEDEKGYMSAVLEKIATRVTAPILVDSTEADVVEEGLKRIPGKAIINSINLEDGETRTAKILPMAKRYGAGVIALTIDEDGMALTAEKKVAIAKRIFELATEKYRIRPIDIIFDLLTLPVSTGQEEYRTAGLETLKAVRLLKKELPEVKTILGVSNISFGLSPYSRQVLNSVFTHEAVTHGLDIAIVNYAKIYPLYKIPKREVELARRLIFHDTSDGDPLANFMEHFSGIKKKPETPAEDLIKLSVEDRLKHCIINGEKAIGKGKRRQGLEQILEEALENYSPLELINNVLLNGMRTVGELFGARKMQLPSVLDSASVMKQSVTYLEPKMDKLGGRRKGTIVLATVKGDVHDIGKNLVDIILSNNGYRVENLGIKQPSANIISAAEKLGADAIGLSGLLVKSTVEMKYVLQDLEKQGLKFPVLCGGAALTRKYVEADLRQEYSSSVFYGEDAFAGLHIMGDLTSENKQERDERLKEGSTPKKSLKPAIVIKETPATRSPAVALAKNIPRPPFFGVRKEIGFDLREIFDYINETALFKNQWQLKTASQDDYLRLVEEKYRPILKTLQEKAIAEGWLEPCAVYGYFPCRSESNDVILYAPPENAMLPNNLPTKEIERFTFPRQKQGRLLSIADYFAPLEGDRTDVIGLSVVTMGARVSEEAQKLFKAGEYTPYLYLHGLGVESAEALAELLHKRMREELGIADEDGKQPRDLFRQKYRGSRYSFGYPACPNLEDQTKIFSLLHPEENIGVRLTSTFQLEPEQSTSAIVVHHPDAKYFMV